jgi:hypothetical protein
VPYAETGNRIEIYSPPYLFRETRPVISDSAREIQYGRQFTVVTSDAATIDEVVLIRNGSVTHSCNFDQRYISVAIIDRKDTELRLLAPPDAAVAPPGFYMLFILRKGIPSVAKMVKMSTYWSLPELPFELRQLINDSITIYDPRTGNPVVDLPMPRDFPLPPNDYPNFQFIVAVDGDIRNLTINPQTGMVERVFISGGDMKAFDRVNQPVTLPFEVEISDTHGKVAGGMEYETVFKAGGAVRGLVLDEGRVIAFIGDR